MGWEDEKEKDEEEEDGTGCCREQLRAAGPVMNDA
jgi:hypothetical protein